MLPASLGSSSSSTSQLDSTYTSLINSMMTVASKPLNALNTKKSDDTTLQGVYTDLQNTLTAFNTSVKALNSTDSTYALGSGSAATITNAPTGSTVLSATSSTGAVPGQYNVAVTTLAKQHIVSSDRQTYTNQSLNLAGTFILGGAATRSVASPVTTPGTVTAFGTSTSIDSGQTELGSGTYNIETSKDSNGSWRYRVVDSDGNAIQIRQAGTTSSYTNGWQAMPSGGGTIDTGRGLTFTLGSDPSAYQVGSMGNGAATVAYTAQGASITVTANEGLTDIASAINKANYASGNAVSASILDNQLVLTNSSSGDNRLIAAGDSTGTVLKSLGVLTSAGGFKNLQQSPSSAHFTVNKFSVTRSTNSNLTDVINGVTLNLASDAEGKSATVNVASDTTTQTSTLNNFVTNFNSLTTYLAAKLGTTKNSDGTYTRGSLAGDNMLYSLRMDLVHMVNGNVSNSGTLTNLTQMGFSLDSNFKLSISDTGKLTDALTNNKGGVTSLIDSLSSSIEAKMTPFTGTTNYVSGKQKSLTNQITNITNQITSTTNRLNKYQQSLINQYAQDQAQLESMTSEASMLTAMFSSYSSTSTSG
ncbi:MAG: flagellar filament capping protein FliD [Anaerolineaceae bacterium]|nr:flagellar filament capping protein FliD [Anaerolineaceae bacterium]